MNAITKLSPFTQTAEDVVRALDLKPLDKEGGYFRRTAEAGLWVKCIDERGDACRAYSVIYALFTADGFSAMHRLAKDEIWCWHAGDTLESLRLYDDGRGEVVRLGPDLSAGDAPQNVIAADVWQGTRLVAGGRWALVSCVVAPEFKWEDFELAEAETLVGSHPKFAYQIKALTRDEPVAGER